MKYSEEYARRQLQKMDDNLLNYFSEFEMKCLCWAFAVALPAGALLAHLT